MLPEVKRQVGFMSVRNHTDQQTGEISCLIRLCRGSVYFAIFFFYRPERRTCLQFHTPDFKFSVKNVRLANNVNAYFNGRPMKFNPSRSKRVYPKMLLTWLV